MSRLSVVHAAKFYPPSRGGMETVIADLCNGTSADWDVRVVAANEEAKTLRERVGAVDVIRTAAFGSAASVPLCPAYPIHLWRHPADCVVLHEPNPVAGTALFARTPATRLVVWHHSDLLRPWWAPHTYGYVQRVLYRRAACVIVSSPNLARFSPLVQQARKVVVIPFGVRLERFRQLTPEQRALAEHLKQTVAGPRVLFVGRFVYYKGVDLLVDAMARSTGTLILAGDGPLEPAIRARVAAHGIESRVIFAGRVSDEQLPAYYDAADVFVLPSVAKTEAFGIVQVEAMAAGLPVISTSLKTGVPWVNQHNVSGIVVEPGSADALAQALKYLATDPDLRSRLARGAAARASDLFSVERMVATFKAVVEQAVRAPHALVDARRVGVEMS
ncbi:MAG TPA: glycosyltransferase [Vicinamibacterales bacterium]|nr:glycosyltransferase [Vicinamibacterales bacterium]